MMIIDLDDQRAQDPALTGGKGSKLAELIAKGFPVPSGFVITTRAFASFLHEINLMPEIDGLLALPTGTGSNDLSRLAESIQDRIRASRLPAAVAANLRKCITESEGTFNQSTLWAVRSSALAEDLTGASFAGQYDTFLGLSGFEAVADAVLRCWASFFNAHSLHYRRDRGISEYRGAVVVQRLILADAAGVCFTTDPLTGAREKVVINSTLGLGEPVVSGQVTPDTFVVDKKSHQLTSRQLGTKETRVIPSERGVRHEQIPETLRHQASLTGRSGIGHRRTSC